MIRHSKRSEREVVAGRTPGAGQRRVVLDQAAMIQRAGERSVPEAADRDDVRRRYEAVLTGPLRARGGASQSRVSYWALSRR